MDVEHGGGDIEDAEVYDRAIFEFASSQTDRLL